MTSILAGRLAKAGHLRIVGGYIGVFAHVAANEEIKTKREKHLLPSLVYYNIPTPKTYARIVEGQQGKHFSVINLSVRMIFGQRAVRGRWLAGNLWRAVCSRSGNLHFACARNQFPEQHSCSGACSCVKMGFISDLTFYVFTPERPTAPPLRPPAQLPVNPTNVVQMDPALSSDNTYHQLQLTPL